MAGFIRRYGFFPGTEVITQIEGVVIVDLPPPGSVQGVGTGTAVYVGEAADMGLATAFDTAGVITTDIRPSEVFGATDLIDKIGPFDPTLGEHGVSLGNLFTALRSKRFSRLVVAPVNQASPQGSRYVRELPVCSTATDPTPALAVSGATIAAGTEFRIGAGRLKVATKVEFTAYPTIHEGVGGSLAVLGAAVTQLFTVAGFDWATDVERPDGSLGARRGDILVIGNDDGTGAIEPVEGGTYRVVADPASGTDVSIERLDGVAFAIGTRTAIPFRLHRSPDADSAPERTLGQSLPGGYSKAQAGGYIIPIRPITNAAGAAADGVHAAGGLAAPAVTPPTTTGDSWSPLGGLQGLLHPDTATAFVQAVQGQNVAASASIDVLYQTALDALISEDPPSRDINIVIVARKSATIRAAQRAHVLNSSAVGRGRTTVLSPPLSVQDVLTATANTGSGVGVNRGERVFYSWPGCVFSVPEAVGTLIATADGDFTEDGILDDTFDHWVGSLLSNLPPERNPAQASAPVPRVLASVLGMQRGVSGLGIQQYTLMRQKGVMGLKLDRTSGPIIQSGVTTSLVSGEKNVNRRRMADFIQDSIAERLVQLAKEPITESWKGDVLTEIDAFMSELLSISNPKAQRISGYELDGEAGNTPALEAKGIYVVVLRVRTLATGDFIVLQTEIGEGVALVTDAA